MFLMTRQYVDVWPRNCGRQCRRKPKWAHPPPELQQLALNFLATFFSRHPPAEQPSFSSAWGPFHYQ